MAIPAANTPVPLEQPHDGVRLVDKDGRLTEYGLQLMESFRDYIVGGNRMIPCVASTTSNVVTLTPNESSPLITGYIDYEAYVFKADATTDGVVTATVVPTTGALTTIKVYKTDGAAQATTGDLVSGSVYIFLFADHLDSSSGGFVIK